MVWACLFWVVQCAMRLLRLIRTIILQQSERHYFGRKQPPPQQIYRHQPKPAWVRREIIRLKALMTDASRYAQALPLPPRPGQQRHGGDRAQRRHHPIRQVRGVRAGASSTGSSPNRLKYTGREDDGTGLYYYRARYYDPAIGRFVSEDPIGFASGDMSFYVYTATRAGRYPGSP